MKGINTMAYINEEENKTATSKKFDLTIKKYEKRINDFQKRLDELNKDAGSHSNEIKTIKEEIEDLKNRISYLRAKESDGFVQTVKEAANIDSDIKGIIDELNKKGYKTKYSSSGHSKL
jgi:predicted RNase H-like nuclease (RuvC/YqgF family)